MKAAIISTSIHAEPEAYRKWANVGELYVAGDVNTPVELEGFLAEVGGTYLSQQVQGNWMCSEFIGWRNIQRRNAALLAAMSDGGYTHYILVDDDNDPGESGLFKNSVRTRFENPTLDIAEVKPRGDLWFNPGIAASTPYRQRGLPSRYMMHQRFNSSEPAASMKVGVLQCYITGDPDTDAVQRIVAPVEVEWYTTDLTPALGTYAPFNSQATVWPSMFAPLAAVLPHSGRYDDIHGSFIATRILHHLGYHVVFGRPYVHQDRNPHNLGKDLEQEVAGMNGADNFVQFLDSCFLPDEAEPMELYALLTESLFNAELISPATFRFVQAYISDVEVG